MILHEIGIGNFRSIGSNPVWINLEKRVNVYIGPNNSGKSNILKAFEWLSQNKSLNKNLTQVEIHQRDAKNLLRIALKAEFEVSDFAPELAGKEFILDFKVQGNQREWLGGPFEDGRSDDHNTLQLINQFMRKYENRHFVKMPNKEELQKEKHKIYQNICTQLLNKVPDSFYIPQFRQIIPGNYSINGQGIVEMLASWQHPAIIDDANIERFKKIQQLLRRLLNLNTIELEVDHTKEHIIVKNNRLRLPLESYGTGVHELIILAVAIYSKQDSIFLIEEPEIHLHPKLQKQFLQFLISETANRYLITTHSNAFIQPSQNVDVIHMRITDDSTSGVRIESSENALQILKDLGINASDILQANSVLWVEGPSDRIYLNRWIRLFSPNLIEGIDYSIMFYGGRLLSHLSLDRDAFPNPSDLIPLLRINQKSVIIIDSDKRKQGVGISKTKRRIKSECRRNNICCWITDGREIENYLSGRAVAKAYQKVTGLNIDVSIDKYDDLEEVLKSSFGSKWRRKWSYNDSKPEFARKIVQFIDSEDIGSDLKKRLNNILNVVCVS